jgi:hypothetical protein
MIAAAWVRVILRKEMYLERLTALDKALIIWVAVGTIIFVLRLKNSGALIYRLGHAYDALGLFFIFRFFIRDSKDLLGAIRTIAIALPILMFLMGFEIFTGRNVFAVFGGVPEHTIIREGRLRAQGPFRHPILAGTFAATSLPLLMSLWHTQRPKDKQLSIVGIFSATIIVVMTASSGPIMTYAAASICILLWKLRKNTRMLWYLFLASLFIIAINMKAPIWFLIGRVSDVLGGTGYHRSMLIEQAIRHFGEWGVAGTSYTAHWMPYTLTTNPNMVDITNQFIQEGIDGGIFTLFAFLVVLVIAFRTLRTAMRSDDALLLDQRILWGLWGSLLSHVVTFFSVTYFDQMSVFWSMLLACVSIAGEKIIISPPSIQEEKKQSLNEIAFVRQDT